MKIHKIIVCAVKGHRLEEKSITNTINRNNWLKKCSRCGMYVMHGDLGSVLLTEKEALEFKIDFEKTFPYSKEKAV